MEAQLQYIRERIAYWGRQEDETEEPLRPVAYAKSADAERRQWCSNAKPESTSAIQKRRGGDNGV